MSESLLQNPWKGLNTYREGEVLYGRDEEIGQLSKLVMQNVQTVVYGRSGIGKSSIINAGLFPRARRSGLFPVSVRLEHNAGPYVAQIRRAVQASLADLHPGQGAKVGGRAEELVAHEGPDEESLWEFFHRFRYTDEEGQPIRPLVVIDQFEEIFTLSKDRVQFDTFFHQLADLLNEVMPDELVGDVDVKPADEADLFGGLAVQAAAQSYLQKSEFHLVFVLREDFLSYLERNTAFIPSLRTNRYCLQAINDEQAASVIMNPRQGLVPKPVAELIIQKVTGDDSVHIDGVPETSVDSAILSLYLSRLFEKMQEQGQQVFTADLVETYSSNIISDFYEEGTRGLSYTALRYLEEELVNKEGRRDNRDRLSVLEHTRLLPEQLDHLIRDVKLLRQFSYGGTLRIEFIHDILCPTIVAHRDKRAAERAARRARRRTAVWIAGFAAFALLVGAYWAINWWRNECVVSECYASFERRAGWPVGVGAPLTEEEQKHTALYYKLSKVGHSAPQFTRVDVCASRGLLPNTPRLSCLEVNPETDAQDVEAQRFIDLLRKVESITFEAGENGMIEKEVVRAAHDSTLFVVSYFHPNAGKDTGKAHELWQTFLTPQGNSLQLRHNRMDRAKVVWDKDGRMLSIAYFDDQGVTRTAADSVFGYHWHRSAMADTVIRYAVDDCGRPIERAQGWNVLVRMDANGSSDTRYAQAYAETDTLPSRWVGAVWGCARVVTRGDSTFYYAPSDLQHPVATSVTKRNGYGQVVEVRQKGDTPEARPQRVTYAYDAHLGYMTSRRQWTAGGRPFAPYASYVNTESWSYYPDGELRSEKRCSARGEEYRLERERDARGNVVRERLDDHAREVFQDMRISRDYKRNSMITRFFGRDGKPMNVKMPVENDTFTVHRINTDSTARRSMRTYFSYDEKSAHQLPLSTTYKEGMLHTYFRSLSTYDKDGNRITYQAFGADGAAVRSMRYYYQNGECVARAAMGVDGTPVRCPNWEEEGFAYYKVYFSRNFSGYYNSISAANEWDAASVFFDALNDRAYHVENVNFKGEALASGYQINSDYYSYVFRDAPNLGRWKMPYLHILSKRSTLYARYGLRDGDRIVAFGAWRWGNPETQLEQEWHRWAAGRVPVNMVVLRPRQDSRNAYRRLAFASVVCTGCAVKNEEYHILPLTLDEEAAIKQVKL